jgi:hypothetical protein
MGQMGVKIFQSFVEGAAKSTTANADSEPPKADQ